jgi:hypothetical protein
MKGTLMRPRAVLGLLLLAATLLSACDLLGGPSATPTPAPPALPGPTAPATAPGTSVAGAVRPTPGRPTRPPEGTRAAPPTTGPASAATPPAGTAPAPTDGADTPGGPLFEVAVNGSREAEVPQGWPLLVLVSLTHPDLAAPDALVTPMTIGTAQGDWSTAIQLTIRNPRGGPETWPLRLAQTPSPTLTLDAERQGTLLWYLAPQDTARLPEGLYTLSATLDTTAAPLAGGWPGHLSAVPVQIRVGPEPLPLSAEQEAEQAELLVAYELWRGQREQALALLDARLTRHPTDFNALTLKADLLAAAGRDPEALALYNQAIDAYLAANPDSDEPPEALLVKRGLLQEKVYNLRRP